LFTPCFIQLNIPFFKSETTSSFAKHDRLLSISLGTLIDYSLPASLSHFIYEIKRASENFAIVCGMSADSSQVVVESKSEREREGKSKSNQFCKLLSR